MFGIFSSVVYSVSKDYISHSTLLPASSDSCTDSATRSSSSHFLMTGISLRNLIVGRPSLEQLADEVAFASIRYEDSRQQEDKAGAPSTSEPEHTDL
ncbi:hypothetical protein AB205_0170640 [Aquarana catesbeiana]|uniref:Uncharacterized protein n=1 Tax=Aquarana catesbeiana TaxID=8400 RepID=A0A2G9RCY1_AQUCT|nr:hypothetical protein AB205_0170640 [Aquarana catesbeiana]